MENELKINLNNQEKDLLLKDLCARLPYGVKIKTPTDCWTSEEGTCELKEIFRGDDGLFRIGDVGALIEYSKPYLFPLSSMTEEQEYQYREVIANSLNHYEVYDWLNKNHFDYRNLIDKNLAIDCTNLNIY